MKRMYTALLLFIFAFQFQQLSAKNNDLIKADYYYSHMAFSDAIRYYEKISGRMEDLRICTQLGDCYRLINDPVQASFWYSKAVSMEGCKDTVKLYYGQVLMQLMQYKEAEKWLSQYQMSNPKDERTANLITGCAIAREMVGNGYAGNQPRLLDFNGSSSEFSPAMWKGKLVFTSDTALGNKRKKDRWTGHAYCNIYTVECDEQGQCSNRFSKIKAVNGLGGKYHIGQCTFTADGKTMYFTRTSDHDGNILSIHKKREVAPLEIMIASGYDEEKEQFTSLESFPYNNKDYSVAHPAISPDGNVLIFSSDMPGGSGATDLYICTRSGSGQWSKPQNLGNGINTAGQELFPSFTDNNTLCFSSDGHAGLGGLDIYECALDRKTKTFTAIRNLGLPFNSSYDDMSYVVSPAGVYFASNRPATKGGDNIYFCKKAEHKEIPVAKPPIVEHKENKKEDDTVLVGVVETARPSSVDKQQEMVAKEQGAKKGIHAEDKQQEMVVKKQSAKVIHAADKPPATSKGEKVTHINNGKKTETKADPAVPAIHEVGIYKDIRINKIFPIPGLYFGFNKTDIISAGADKLKDLYELLRLNPELKIQIQAYSDCRGTVEINHRISLRRANALKQYLMSKGVSAERLSCKGYGIEHPVVKCDPCNSCPDDQHEQNRRIEFKVVKM